MAPLVPSLLGSLTRQLYAFVRCLPPPGATRCISTLAAAVHSRGTIAPARFLFTPIRSPLLGQIPHLAALQPSAGMKTRTALKKRCKDCFFVRRRGRLFVFCKSHPRHKQRQG